ncbi:MAG: response regulator [Syntrophomonadaceae bacterium]|nr:response regulator [Syntrophomonadaceae bacterium]MDD3022386.1 response regulator [Syntrophomonadaceae bacterium]
MNSKILLVDDEENIISAYKRVLHRKFEFFEAQNGHEALAILREHGPFAVIISDFRMPEMDGIQFLRQARKLFPDTVRIMLTGQADMQDAIDAINQGSIFRFLNKPCPSELLLETLNTAVEQYRLIHAERELLDQTLKGSIKILIDILSIANPGAFSQAGRIRSLARKLAIRLKVESIWEVEIAALLSHIGYITIPVEILKKVEARQELSPNEENIFVKHPQIAQKLLHNIPRLEGIAEGIAYQFKQFDGGGLPANDKKGKLIPLISRILKLTHDFEQLLKSGLNANQAIDRMRINYDCYDPDVFAALEAEMMNIKEGFLLGYVSVSELLPGMILADDIKDQNGIILIPRLYVISNILKMRLMNYLLMGSIREPIKILQAINKTVI